MEVVHGGVNGGPAGGSVSALGVFDGVHVGHQALLHRVRRIADEEALQATVVLLDPHPRTVDGTAPRLLTDLDQRCQLLAAAGVELAYVLRAGADTAAPGELVRGVLRDHLAVRVHVAGEGRDEVDLADRVAREVAEVPGHGIRAVTMPLTTVDGHPGAVSSSAAREVVGRGDVALATTLLGRPHEVRGVVEQGDARGRTIGFPTANVTVPGETLLPRNGVYAGLYVGTDGVARPSAINVGRRPTFYDESGLLLVEAHVIDFDGDLYGERASVRFVQRLRDEQRFDGIDALVAQLRSDVDAARVVLS